MNLDIVVGQTVRKIRSMTDFHRYSYLRNNYNTNGKVRWNYVRAIIEIIYTLKYLGKRVLVEMV